MNKDKQILQVSENADVTYYKDSSVRVDNYDREVSFSNPQDFKADVAIDEEGNIEIIPFGTKPGSRRGPRRISICDTGVARFSRSPMSKNIHLSICLPQAIASHKNFRHQLSELIDKMNELGLDYNS